MLSKEECKQKMKQLNCCVIIPTYNNEKTLALVIDSALEYANDVFVVNDGATDASSSIISQFQNKITAIEYSPNRGKGNALRKGFEAATAKGFEYAITIDSDGQHYAEDITVFIQKIEEAPGAILVGSRNLNQENMPKKNTFGNKFSNFWFKLFTHINLPDTQSGFRLYPLQRIKGIPFFSTKYEFEVEVLVKSAWRNIPILPVPINVFYAEGNERITHFRPGRDFTRISILNTYLFFLAFLWYKPKFLIQHLKPSRLKKLVKDAFLNPNESNFKKSIGVAFGVFMGIIPIWGYQFVSALLLAHLLKLNKAIVGFSAQISFPPMIPVIVYGSLKLGQFVLGSSNQAHNYDNTINNADRIWEAIKLHFSEYLIGSLLLAVVMAILLGSISFFVLQLRTSAQKTSNKN
jgi:glycosyltransferase involved in cell wall biosynthesis